MVCSLPARPAPCAIPPLPFPHSLSPSLPSSSYYSALPSFSLKPSHPVFAIQLLLPIQPRYCALVIAVRPLINLHPKKSHTFFLLTTTTELLFSPCFCFSSLSSSRHLHTMLHFQQISLSLHFSRLAFTLP